MLAPFWPPSSSGHAMPSTTAPSAHGAELTRTLGCKSDSTALRAGWPWRATSPCCGRTALPCTHSGTALAARAACANASGAGSCERRGGAVGACASVCSMGTGLMLGLLLAPLVVLRLPAATPA